MPRRQAHALSRAVEPAQLMVPQCEGPVASFHVRAGALEHVSKLGCSFVQLTLLSQAQVTQLSLSRLNVKCRQNLEIRYYGANVVTSCFLECQKPGELKSR